MKGRTFLTGIAALPVAHTAARFQTLAALLEGKHPLSASMWIYLWDLLDEGYPQVLQRLKEHGLTSISVATAYHAGRFLEPHNPKRKVVFLEDGTVYFSPEPSLYGRIKPIPNSLVEHGHGLREVRKNAEAMGLTTRSWVVCCHNTTLGTTYPDVTCETAFGDKLYHNLCPSNDDVRKYISAVVRDTASNGVDTIELEALQFQGYSHGYHHERDGIPLNGGMKFLLGLCFCPSCIKRATEAKVDIGSVRTFTRTTLETHFANPSLLGERYASIEQFPADIFAPFMDWRASVVGSLIEELADAVKQTSVKLRPMVSLDPIAQRSAGVDPQRAANATGGVLALGYVKDGPALRAPLASLQSQLAGKEITLGFQVGLPESGGKAEFISRMSIARELGISSFNYYNYGLIPYENLEWIKESLGG